MNVEHELSNIQIHVDQRLEERYLGLNDKLATKSRFKRRKSIPKVEDQRRAQNI